MTVIEYIKADCFQMEDNTLTDDLEFYVDDKLIGSLEMYIGHSKWVYGPVPVSPGSTLSIYEVDALDPNDLLVSYTFTEADLGRDEPLLLPPSAPPSSYNFDVKFATTS